jgi:hypothetical protein
MWVEGPDIAAKEGRPCTDACRNSKTNEIQHRSHRRIDMKKLTSAFLLATLFLAPVLAAAQTSGGAGGTKAPGSNPADTPGSNPADKPGSSPADRPTGSPGMGQPTQPGSGTPDPAASPRSGFDLSRHNTRADCEKAGGKWGEVSQSCTQK